MVDFRIYPAYDVDFNMPKPLARCGLNDIPAIGTQVMAVCLEDDDGGFGCIATVEKILMPEDFYGRKKGELPENYALLTLDTGRWGKNE